MQLIDLLKVENRIEIMDVGAAAINEKPIYKKLLDIEIANLTAFDGDQRQIAAIKALYGDHNCTVIDAFLFDGNTHNVYVCHPKSGMTSLFEPNEAVLKFFNGFVDFGKVYSTEIVTTVRLDEIDEVSEPDFVKMDVQGAELTILQNAQQKLKKCLAIQLEVSFLPLYHNQPSFGDIDLYLRSLGFVPHRFTEVKRWSIAPTLFNGKINVPGNQLLEGDIIYIRNPTDLSAYNDQQIIKLIFLSHYCFKSFDLSVWLFLELEKRRKIKRNLHKEYLKYASDIS